MNLCADLPYLKVQGTAYEAGRQQGKRFTDLIHYTWRLRRKKLFDRNMKDLVARTRWLLGETRRRFPEEIEEIAGIADGAALDFDRAFMLNRHLCAAIGCTTVGFARSAQGPLVAGNLDDNPIYFLKEADIRGQYRYLVSAWPGTLGAGNGMNEHGLALMGSSASSRFKPYGKARGFLTDNYAIANRVLRSCKTVAEAIDLLKRPDIGGHGNHLIADAAGNLVCVEKYAHRLQAIRYPDEQGFLFTVNCFLSEFLPNPAQASRGQRNSAVAETRPVPKLKTDGYMSEPAAAHRMEKMPATSVDRLAVLERFGKATARRTRTLADLRQIMGDSRVGKANYPISNPATVMGMIAVLARRELRVSEGPPHLGRYKTFTLRDSAGS